MVADDGGNGLLAADGRPRFGEQSSLLVEVLPAMSSGTFATVVEGGPYVALPAVAIVEREWAWAAWFRREGVLYGVAHVGRYGWVLLERVQWEVFGRNAWWEINEMGNKLLAKASKGVAGRKGGDNPLQPDFRKKFPYLTAFLTEQLDAEDKARELSRVTVFVDSGSLKACLSDPTQRATVYVTIASPGDVWDALERSLASDDPDWRHWPSQDKRKRV